MPDEYGAIKALIFEKQNYDPTTGKFSNAGEFATFPARTVCVAAGTSPNVIYEKEKPGTFKLDEWRQFFQPFKLEKNGDGKFHAASEKGRRRVLILRKRRKIHRIMRQHPKMRESSKSDGFAKRVFERGELLSKNCDGGAYAGGKRRDRRQARSDFGEQLRACRKSRAA